MRVALHNLGCKVNAYETEAMTQLFVKKGYEIVPFTESADVYVINTCTVTNIADRKSRQMLHRAKKNNPGALIVATGCYVQSEGDALVCDDSIDLIIGNNKKGEVVTLVENYLRTKESERCAVIDINHTSEYEALSIETTTEHTRAYVKIQDGCNQFCSYCRIPYVRGRVRSRRPEEVLEEVKKLTAAGYQEIVLTGIHLTSYGTDFEEETTDLLSLLKMLDRCEGVKRLRFGSLEPRIFTESFVQELSTISSLCPHFHLSLQSGCDAVLRRMNRKYTTEEYRQSCNRLRRYFQNPAITTDVIVGFPQETEEEFETTCAFLRDIQLADAHIFKYSRRKETVADRMPGQVAEPVKNARSAVLLTLTEETRQNYLRNFLGQTVSVLFEEPIEIHGAHGYVGHTREYIKVAVIAEQSLENQILSVLCESMEENGLFLGKLLP